MRVDIKAHMGDGTIIEASGFNLYEALMRLENNTYVQRKSRKKKLDEVQSLYNAVQEVRQSG